MRRVWFALVLVVLIFVAGCGFLKDVGVLEGSKKSTCKTDADCTYCASDIAYSGMCRLNAEGDYECEEEGRKDCGIMYAPEGKGVCVLNNGAAVCQKKGQTPPPENKASALPKQAISVAGCVDSDGGIDAGTAGKVNGIEGTSLADECMDPSTLAEAYCAPQGDPGRQNILCFDFKATCKDARCVPD